MKKFYFQWQSEKGVTEWLIYKLETDINQIYINLGISEDSQNFSFLPFVQWHQIVFLYTTYMSMSEEKVWLFEESEVPLIKVKYI